MIGGRSAMEEMLRSASDDPPVLSVSIHPTGSAAREMQADVARPAGAVTRCADALRIVVDPNLPINLRVHTSAALVAHLDEAVSRTPDDPRLRRFARAHDAATHDRLLPVLAALGNELVGWADLNSFERIRVIDTFEHQLHPLLTPMAVDAAHPFPRVPTLSVNIALQVREPFDRRPRFVCITLPADRPRFVPVHAGRVVATESVVGALLPRLVAGVEVVECSCFRVTRSAGSVVRLELEQRTSAEMTGLLSRRFAVPESRIHRLRTALAMGPALAELLPGEGVP